MDERRDRVHSDIPEFGRSLNDQSYWAGYSIATKRADEERARLEGIIVRMDAVLAKVGHRSLVDIELFLHRQGHEGMSHAISVVRESISRSREILTEALPSPPASVR